MNHILRIRNTKPLRGEIKLADNFVKDLLSKEDVSVVYVKEVKTLSQTTIYKG